MTRCSLSAISASSLQAFPLRMRTHIMHMTPKRRPAHIEYSPPSPIASCKGAAISEAIIPETPRKQLLDAIAAVERPPLASTMYARVLLYTNLLKSQHNLESQWLRNSQDGESGDKERNDWAGNMGVLLSGPSVCQYRWGQ